MQRVVVKGRVSGVDSAKDYVDKKQRISITFRIGESHATIRMPNDAGFVLDQELDLTISPVEQGGS